MSAAALLAAIDEVLAHRLDGDAYERYTEAAKQWAGTPNDKLLEMRAQLQAELAAQSGYFRYAEFGG